MKKCLYILLILCLVSGITACTWKKGAPEAGYSDYPDPIGKIMLTHCAVTGCHTTDSKGASAGLDLSSWSHLFEGSKANSAVVPFRPDYSFLFYSVNMFDDLGLKLLPVMPVNANALSREDVNTIRDWIAAGAPDKNGYVKFSENPDRRKINVVNQGCDLVAVFDAESRILMHYVDVGVSAGIEVPHSITVSPDNQIWYVSFIGNSIIEKYRCSDDVKIGQVDLGNAGWHTMAVSGDSRYGIAVNWESDGKIALIDLNTMSLISKYSGSGLFVSPHGCAINQDGTRAYVTAQAGNRKISLNGPAPHHVSNCSVRNGYATAISLNTLEVLPDFKAELSVDP